MCRSAWIAKGELWIISLTPRLWRTVKYEEVYIHDYTSPREARHSLASYFEFYNCERPHQALDYQCPAEVYFAKDRQEIRSVKGSEWQNRGPGEAKDDSTDGNR